MTHSRVRFRVNVLAIPILLLLPVVYIRMFMRRKYDEGDPTIIVIPQTTRIGDLVCTTPVFREIKTKYPKGKLIVAVGPKNEPIIRHNPLIDKIIIFEEKEYTDFFGPLRFFKNIRRERPDWGINVATSAMGTLMLLYALVPRRIKITKPERPFSEWLTDWTNTFTIPYKTGERMPRLYLKALAPLNIDMPIVIRKEVYTDPPSLKKAEDFLGERGMDTKDLIIGMSVTAGNEIKEWKPENFGKLAQKLIDTYNAKIVFIGSQNDENKIAKANRVIGGKGIVATGSFKLHEVPSLMKFFDVFISADTGTIHIADALDIPLIDIVGPVDPTEQAPEGELRMVITPPEPIKPTVFALRKAGDPKESRRAADAVSDTKVFDAFKKLYAMIPKRK